MEATVTTIDLLIQNKEMEAIERNIALLIQNDEGEEIFSIESNGEVHWMKNGKLVKVKTNKELSLSFAKALEEVVKLSNAYKETLGQLANPILQ